MWLLHSATVLDPGTKAQGGIMVYAVRPSPNNGADGIEQASPADGIEQASRRDAEKCQRFFNEGHWDGDYQKWSPAAAAAGQSATDILEAFLRSDASDPQPFRHILFCGDSTVSRF